MQQYLELLEKCLHGTVKTDRTLTGTTSVFGPQMRFDLARGFPLLTTKKVHFKSIVHELIWMISGNTNIKYLKDNGVKIWDAWADEHGELGPVYGAQWRKWPCYDLYCGQEPDVEHIDQLQQAIDLLKNDPDSRRIVVSAWNVADLPHMALAPCHCLFQFYTRDLDINERIDQLDDELVQADSYLQEQGAFLGDHPVHLENLTRHLDTLGVPRKALDCQLYQRSADVFLGVPFNIASYALLTTMVAQVVNMVPGDFVWTGGDVHLYSNHYEQALRQLNRQPGSLPQLVLNPAVSNLFDFRFEDITLEGYEPQSSIKAPVAV